MRHCEAESITSAPSVVKVKVVLSAGRSKDKHDEGLKIDSRHGDEWGDGDARLWAASLVSLGASTRWGHAQD